MSNKTKCIVDSCIRPAISKGLCENCLGQLTLYNDWPTVNANINIGDKIVNLRCPSKIALGGALGHLASDGNVLFIRNAGKARPIKYIVDVGANLGAVSLMLHTAFPTAKILAIEPIKGNYDCLLHNIKDFPSITPLKMAVHNKRAEIRLSMPTHKQRPDLDIKFGNSGLYSIHGKDLEHSEVVQADKLDDIVDAKVDLLKIDVEGAEAFVFAGATRIMDKDRPTVIVELREENLAMAKKIPAQYAIYFKAIGYRKVGTYRGDVVLCPEEDFTEWTMP